MSLDNVGGLTLAGISCQSSGSVPCKMAKSARREATKAEVGQTGLVINRTALHSSFAKDAPHRAFMLRSWPENFAGLVQGHLL